ncbi:unnamed protein product [Nippostrongylus brasiliensis]|uniref:Uncharacterized protein n=2 Tax=Nippostrongylus brasiliensis TaxID=27835 RepID=A0A0N4YCV0_NIPBR|nr:unnamed protein product [Nippostrongylus brasiliensis]
MTIRSTSYRHHQTLGKCAEESGADQFNADNRKNPQIKTFDMETIAASSDTSSAITHQPTPSTNAIPQVSIEPLTSLFKRKLRDFPPPPSSASSLSSSWSPPSISSKRVQEKTNFLVALGRIEFGTRLAYTLPLGNFSRDLNPFTDQAP